MWEQSSWWRKQDEPEEVKQPVRTRGARPYNPHTIQQKQPTHRRQPTNRRRRFPRRTFPKRIEKPVKPTPNPQKTSKKPLPPALDDMELKEKRAQSFEKGQLREDNKYLFTLFSKQKRLIQRSVAIGIIEKHEEFSRGQFRRACQDVDVKTLKALDEITKINEKIEALSFKKKTKTVNFGGVMHLSEKKEKDWERKQLDKFCRPLVLRERKYSKAGRFAAYQIKTQRVVPEPQFPVISRNSYTSPHNQQPSTTVTTRSPRTELKPTVPVPCETPIDYDSTDSEVLSLSTQSSNSDTDSTEDLSLNSSSSSSALPAWEQSLWWRAPIRAI